MFPDSNTAKYFKLGPDNKLKYCINFEIVLYFKSLLIDSLKVSECFVISFDESLNYVAHSSEIDLLLCYSDKTNNIVKTCFL